MNKERNFVLVCHKQTNSYRMSRKFYHLLQKKKLVMNICHTPELHTLYSYDNLCNTIELCRWQFNSVAYFPVLVHSHVCYCGCTCENILWYVCPLNIFSRGVFSLSPATCKLNCHVTVLKKFPRFYSQVTVDWKFHKVSSKVCFTDDLWGIVLCIEWHKLLMTHVGNTHGNLWVSLGI